MIVSAPVSVHLPKVTTPADELSAPTSYPILSYRDIVISSCPSKTKAETKRRGRPPKIKNMSDYITHVSPRNDKTTPRTYITVSEKLSRVQKRVNSAESQPMINTMFKSEIVKDLYIRP